MIMLAAMLLQAASPAVSDPRTIPDAEITDQVVGTAGSRVISQLPTGKEWLAMTPGARRLHSVISVEALRINPNFRKCAALTPIAFEEKMGANAAADPASATITITALALYDLCPPGN